MSYIYLVPQWFFGFDITMELLFSIVCFLVSWYAYNIYKISKHRESKLFAISFILIAFSYFIKAIMNIFILGEIGNGVRGLTFNHLSAFGALAFYSYVFLFGIGIITLAYMTFKVKSPKIYSLLVILDILVIILSIDKTIAFGIFSSLVILYVCIHYGIEYTKNKNYRTFLLFIAFALLFFTGVEISIVQVVFKFVISQFLELGAYILIFISLVFTMKRRAQNGKKKNKA